MNKSIDMSPDMLRSVLRDYLVENAESIVQNMMDSIYVQCLAENHLSDEDNDGAEVVIRFKVPGTRECDRLLDNRMAVNTDPSGD